MDCVVIFKQLGIYNVDLASFLNFLADVSPASCCLNQVRHVTGHLFDSCVIMLLEFLQCASVSISDEVDGDTFAAETSTTTDSKEEGKLIE